MGNKYTIPKISKKNVDRWYVHFRYEGKLKMYRSGLNRIKNLKEREIEANALATFLYEKLKKGWNPNSDTIEVNNSMNFYKSLDFALEKMKDRISVKTFHDYSGTIRYVQKAILKLDYENLSSRDIKRANILSIMENIKKERKWSNKAYNKNLGYFKSVLSELIQWELLEHNPAYTIKSLKEEQTIANIPPTDEEQNEIKKHLLKVKPEFLKFVQVIYDTGIRPVEVSLLQIKDIDLENQVIVIPAEKTKTSKDRIVPVNGYLYKMFKEMDLSRFPNEYYVFGSNLKNGGRSKNFIPGEFKIRRDTATKTLKKLIKDDLGINKNLYSEKHKGADDKIVAGIDLDALRDLYGHSSKLMTEKYARKVKEVYRKQIIDKSPEF